MKKTIENVQDARAGDWLKGIYLGHRFEGELWTSDLCYFIVGSTPAMRNGVPASGIHIESITREIPDLPTKPGVVFFATVRGVENVQLMVTTSPTGEQYLSPRCIGDSRYHGPETIDPESVRIAYTPGQEAGQ